MSKSVFEVIWNLRLSRDRSYEASSAKRHFLSRPWVERQAWEQNHRPCYHRACVDLFAQLFEHPWPPLLRSPLPPRIDEGISRILYRDKLSRSNYLDVEARLAAVCFRLRPCADLALRIFGIFQTQHPPLIPLPCHL
jgi:hypothetical protein